VHNYYPKYPQKLVRDNVTAPFSLLSVVIVTLQYKTVPVPNSTFQYNFTVYQFDAIYLIAGGSISDLQLRLLIEPRLFVREVICPQF